MQIKHVGRLVILMAAIIAFAAQGAAQGVEAPPAPAVPPAPEAPAAPPAPAAVAAEPAQPQADVPPALPSVEEGTPPAPKAVEPVAEAEASAAVEENKRDKMKDMLFDMHKKQEWLALSKEERASVLEDILPAMTFNGLSGARLEEAVPAINDCTGEELTKDEYARFDVATAVTKCLFKLGYAP